MAAATLLDVRQELLTPTDFETSCPYKGTAKCWSIGDHENVAWSYPSPLPESQPIQGLVCFYDDIVDFYVDDVPPVRESGPTDSKS